MQGRERGEEHRPFELPVPASGGVFTMDRGAGLPGCGGGEAGVGGEVGGAREGAAVTDGGQEDCCGPDADAGQRGQDRGKRVGLRQGFVLGFQGPALFVDGGQRLRRRRDDHVEGAGARDDDGLFVERGEDVVDEPFGDVRCPRADDVDQPAAAHLAQSGRGSVALEEPGDGLMVQPGAEDAFEAGTVSGRAPMEAGWSTTTRAMLNLAFSLSKTARSWGSLLGSGLSNTVFPAGVRPCP